MAHELLYGASFTKGALSFTDKQGRTICNADLWNFLTLTATADNSSVKLTKVGTLDNTFEVNVGNGWKYYAFDTVIPLKAGESCKWRCSARPTMQSATSYVKFVMTGTIEASGNCNSMLSSYFENLTSLSENDYAFFRLFIDCTSLTKAPILPATTLAPGCYSCMFYGCTSLVSAPELPATVLSSSCYYSMFYGCTSLVSAPELPATYLDGNCCAYMFYGCTSLAQAPKLPAITLTTYCYSSMFRNCTSLTRAPELPATNLATSLAHHCYDSMFSGCTSLSQSPLLPATTLSNLCYYCMFKGCTSLTKAPWLPATTLTEGCYQSMFRGCSALTEVHISATSTHVEALLNWLSDVSPTGDFYCDPQSTIFPTGASGIPEGWTRLPLSDYPTT